MNNGARSRTSNKTPVTIVMPAHNEETTIVAAIKRVFSVVDPELEVTVVAVNDGSKDGTLQAIHSIKDPRVKVISYPENRGKGFALKLGLGQTTTEFVGYLDADLDLHPDALMKAFTQLISESNVDVVVGSKLHPDSVVSYSKLRSLFSATYRLFVQALFSFDISDTQTGLKAFRRQPLMNVLSLCESEGWAFDLELLARLNREGAHMVEIPITLDYGFDSRMNLITITHTIFDTFYIFFRTSRKSRDFSRRTS